MTGKEGAGTKKETLWSENISRIWMLVGGVRKLEDPGMAAKLLA